MKNYIGFLSFCVVVFCALTYGTSNASENTLSNNEASKVETVAETTDVLNNNEVVVHCGSDSEGFGRCAESGCYCKEFKGRGETCRNCGHAYRRHY